MEFTRSTKFDADADRIRKRVLRKTHPRFSRPLARSRVGRTEYRVPAAVRRYSRPVISELDLNTMDNVDLVTMSNMICMHGIKGGFYLV
jgi:hypothetical protein